MLKSLTNRLYLKKQLYKLKIDEETYVRDHKNNFSKCITQLLSVDVKIDKEHKTVILLAPIPKTYETLVSTLLVGKMMLIVYDVSTALLETTNMEEPSTTPHIKQVLVAKSDSNRGRSKSRVRCYDKRDDSSKTKEGY